MLAGASGIVAVRLEFICSSWLRTSPRLSTRVRRFKPPRQVDRDQAAVAQLGDREPRRLPVDVGVRADHGVDDPPCQPDAR